MRIPSDATYSANEVDDRPGFYYVSIIDGDRFGLLAGPYPSHREALDMVQPARQASYRVNSAQSSFSGFGTCRLEKSAGAGILNRYGEI